MPVTLDIYKTALVTGGTKRLGLAFAETLSQYGFSIGIHYNSAGDDLDHCYKTLSQNAEQVAFFSADFSDPASTLQVISNFEEVFGTPPDILINSASLFQWDDIGTLNAQGLQTHYRVNTIAPALLIREMVAKREKLPDKTGLIINILDQKMFNLNGDHLSYTLSKYALMGLTEVLAKELAPHYRVCGIAPGYTLPGPDENEQDFRAKHALTPLEIGVQVEDLQSALRYLVETPSITGDILRVDAGAHMGPKQRDFAFLKPDGS